MSPAVGATAQSGPWQRRRLFFCHCLSIPSYLGEHVDNLYQRPEARPPKSSLSPASPWLIVFGVVLSALPAFTCSLVVEQFRQVLQGFGADLPALTRAVLGYHPLRWLAPVATAVLAARSRPAVRAKRAVLAGLASAICLIPICAIAMYLPIFGLAAVVG